MVSFFGPDPVLYIDAGLGFAWPSRAALLQVWTNPPFSTANPDALSYPLRVIGDCHSALIEFVDTPPLLGKEFRFLSSITFNDKCQIVRWIDYWDGRSSQTKIPIGTFGPYPPDFHDGVVNASATIKKVAQALQNAFSAGDAAKAAQPFMPDAVFEDMALHTRVRRANCTFSAVPDAGSGDAALRAQRVPRPCRRQRPGRRLRVARHCVRIFCSCVTSPGSNWTTTAKSTRFTTIYDYFSSQTRFTNRSCNSGAEK